MLEYEIPNFFKIILFTSRYMGRTNENKKKVYELGYQETLKQLRNWKVNFHKLMLLIRESFN